MINVKIVAVGNLKEQYLKDACGEYIKRLKRYCNISVKELNESKLSDKASPKDIQKSAGNGRKSYTQRMPRISDSHVHRGKTAFQR